MEGFVTAEDGVRLWAQGVGSGRKGIIVPNAVHMIDSFRCLGETREVVFFDLRNRGGSEAVADRAKLARGIHHDVDDLEAVRRHFGIERLSVIGHSYVALTAILYALKYPQHVNRLVLIGTPPPKAGTQYAGQGDDGAIREFAGKLGQIREEDPRERCRKAWDLVRVLQVADAADAWKVAWSPCEFPNEWSFLKHWMENLQPSIQELDLTAEAGKVAAPMLIVHGVKDRQAPYGGAKEWASLLPNARLLTVENAAHVPWVEDRERVMGEIEAFLG